MKLAKWLALLLVVFVTGVFASEVVLYEDFEDPKFPPKGWTVFNNYPYSYWMRDDEHGKENHYACGCADDNEGWAFLSTPLINSRADHKIKISLRYVFSTEMGVGNAYFSFKEYRKEFTRNTWKWRVISFTVSGPTHDSLNFGIGYGYLGIDDVTVTRCLIGIEPNSLGKIKALYN